MWISGRRAFRPDREFYRSKRRVNLRRPRGRQVSAITIATGAVVALCFLVWLFFRH